MSFKGAIFDLDGVIVDTVPLHFKAWKKMFNEYGKEFSFEDYKKKVDGIPRMDGARAILVDLSPEELEEAAQKKQSYYRQYLETEGVRVYAGGLRLMKELRHRGVKIAIISSSKNCPLIIERVGLENLIDAQVNGNDISKGKPDPQIFLMALDRLGLQVWECIGFEDALLGVEAAKRAGLVTVGIDRHNDPKRLEKADLVISDLGELNYAKLASLLEK